MKNALYLSSIIGLLFAISCQNKKDVPKASPLEVYADSLFKRAIDSAEIAGGSILAFQNNTMLLEKSYGKANLELSVPMPDHAKFEIGSVSKQFTAAAILKLVEAKKLSLDDDFTKYLDFDTKGRTVTINNLLNHTSGIPSYTEMREFWDLSIEQHPRDTLVRLVEQKEFLFEPNEASIYNNSAYFFLGLIIEKVSGKPYEEFLEQEIFEPLGMENTSYCSNVDIEINKVSGYDYTPKGLQQKGYLNHTWPYAAGSLCSTKEDLLIWMKALHGQKILSESLYQSLISPDTLNDGTRLHYAKGLVNYSNFGHPEISHGGGINGFLSETRYYPDDDLYIICLVNTTGPKGAGYFADELTWQILNKKDYDVLEIDFNTADLEGVYTGAARGRILTLEVNAIPDGVTLKSPGDTSVDTLKVYVGNHTWMEENEKISIDKDQIRIDEGYNYYILKKEN